MPSLAERRDDVAELATFFCGVVSERHNLPRVGLSPAALRAVEASDWPGNVRQLCHAVEAAVIRAAGEGAHQVESSHLFPERGTAPAVGNGAHAMSFQEHTRRFQAALLREALEASDWNVNDVARQFDLGRSHVYKLIHAFGLRRATK